MNKDSKKIGKSNITIDEKKIVIIFHFKKNMLLNTLSFRPKKKHPKLTDHILWLRRKVLAYRKSGGVKNI